MSRRQLLQARAPPAQRAPQSTRHSRARSPLLCRFHCLHRLLPRSPVIHCTLLSAPGALPTCQLIHDVSMQIAILGTGPVGRALGKAFSAAGLEVVIGTRDPEPFRLAGGVGRTRPAARSVPGLTRTCSSTRRMARLAGHLRAVGDALNGKVVIDTSNASTSPWVSTLTFVSNTDSVAEQLQRAHTEARLVKMFNTMNNEVMANPRGLADDSTIFVAGNDVIARQTAASLAADLGWTDVFDLGDLTAARAASRCTFRCGCGCLLNSTALSSTSKSSADLIPVCPAA